MHMPLEGIRVLEWAVFHAGPGGPAILSDLGAEVIKIERPGTGDPCRQQWRYKDIDFRLPGGRNIFYEGANRGKKSVTIDLARPEGQEVAHRLVEKSDVFFTNLRKHTVQGAKMDYATLSKINPRLIYASVTGYGPLGPDAGRAAFDYQGQGKSGFMYCIGEPGMPPLLAQFGVIDQATAIMASYQVVIALLIRERFGVGQEVDVSLLGTASYLMYLNELVALLKGTEVPRHEQASADPLRNYYQCKDGRWVVQNQPGEESWQTVCELLGLQELVDDPRFDTRDKRLDNSRELVQIFNEAFRTKSSDEWVRLFNEKDLIICHVNTTTEAINDPQMAENGYIVDFHHPDIGRIRIPGFPIRFGQAKIDPNLLAPNLGQHTVAVLEEILGYTDQEVARLKEQGVI
jgi:crotonobetainyl-CoA:carnitine CoA-transferase CaiB-like acyl-CoA transferase